jgi:acetylornithine deacetylase
MIQGRPSLGVSECVVEVDFRFVPGVSLDTVKEDIRRVLYRLMVDDPELDVTVKFSSHACGPAELPNDHVIHNALRKAHKEIFGENLIIDTDVKGGASLERMIDRMKYSASDIVNFYAVGIPGTNYGASKVAVTPDERVSIPQFVKHCRVATLEALEMCGVK